MINIQIELTETSQVFRILIEWGTILVGLRIDLRTTHSSCFVFFSSAASII